MDGALSDDMVVVRFSPMTPDGLFRRAEVAYRDEGRYSLSVFCRPISEGQTLDDLLVELCAEAPAGGKKVWTTTVRRLGEAGYALQYRPPPPCHYEVDLGIEPTGEAIERFVQAFDQPRRNPAWSPR